MANIPLNFAVDLESNRIVRDNNSSVGLRSYSFSEGSTYTGSIELVHGGTVSELTIEIGNDTNDIALVRHDGTDGNFSLSCNGDFVRQYLYGSLAKHTVLNISLSVGGSVHVLDSVPCLLVANPDDNTGASVTWDGISDKPTVFPPDAHTHAVADVVGLQAALDGKASVSPGLVVYAFKTEPQDALDATFTPIKFDNIYAGAALTADEGIGFTLPAGRYQISTCVGFGMINSGTTLQCLVSLWVDDYEVARLGRQYLTAPDNWHQTIIGSHIVELSVPKLIYIAAYQDKSGEPQPISTDFYTTWLQIYKLS